MTTRGRLAAGFASALVAATVLSGCGAPARPAKSGNAAANAAANSAARAQASNSAARAEAGKSAARAEERRETRVHQEAAAAATADADFDRFERSEKNRIAPAQGKSRR